MESRPVNIKNVYRVHAGVSAEEMRQKNAVFAKNLRSDMHESTGSKRKSIVTRMYPVLPAVY